MANNRLYLTNKLTGEKILLAKYWHGHGWQSHVEESGIQSFLDNADKTEMYSKNDIDIEYENDFYKKDVYKIADEIIQRRGLIFEKDLFDKSAIKLKPKNVADLIANLYWVIKLYEAEYKLMEVEREINSLE